MHRTRIKICGITREEDALAAAHLGADAIGFVFYQPSKRYVSIDRAANIASRLPPFVSTVALFVNAEADFVADVESRLRPAFLQFHGDEDEVFCRRFKTPYLKALRVGEGFGGDDLLKSQPTFSSARALLLDTLIKDAPGVYGGTGKAFDWRLVPAEMRPRIILSGGLSPDNVGNAVRMIRPWAVDVSSGVEVPGRKGIKDHGLIGRFIEAVKNADV